MATRSMDFLTDDLKFHNPPAYSTRSNGRRDAVGNTQKVQKPAKTTAKTVKPANRAPSKKRKAENAEHEGQTKSAKTALKTSPARQDFEAAPTMSNVTKSKQVSKAPAKRPSRGNATRKVAASSSAAISIAKAKTPEAEAEAAAAAPVSELTIVESTLGTNLDGSDSDSDLSTLSSKDDDELDKLEEELEEYHEVVLKSDRREALPKTPSSTVVSRQAQGGLPTPVSAPQIRDTAVSTDLEEAVPSAADVETIHTEVKATDTSRATAFVTRSGRTSKPAARYLDSTSVAGKADTDATRHESLSLTGLREEDGRLHKLVVSLKVAASWLKKNRELNAARPKTSSEPKTPETFPKPLRTLGVQKPTLTTPAARKLSLASVGIPTPLAEQDEKGLETLELETQIDPKQLRISRKLTSRLPIASKPAPQGSPEVWADSRQALCETVPYFKMPQSGCHQNDGHVYAFLYDGASRCREYMDTDVIIGGAGGGMETDSTGQLVQKKNHTMEEAQVKAVLNDIEHKNPLVVICGSKSEGAICKMPHRYNVLGWFKPVAVWAEKTIGKKKTWTTIKYRFERLGQSKAAWHAPTTDSSPTLTPEERQSVAPLVKQTCQHCSASHFAIYLVGWMCLTPECDQFWKLPSGKDAPYGILDYTPAFLLARTEWTIETEPFSVRPPVLDVGHAVGDNLTQINTRGMCCPRCGRCNSRRLFKGWMCENPACTYENFPKHIPVEIPLLHQPWESVGNGPALARNKHDKSQGVQLAVEFKHGYKAHRYTFPGISGSLTHLISNATINKLSGGPDEMFRAMQTSDMHLERRRFGVEKMSGSKAENNSQVTTDAANVAGPSKLSLGESSETSREQRDGLAPIISEKRVPRTETKKQEMEDGDFMTAFSMNYGMPYKFVANGASLPFKDSPWPVRAARADLNWAAQNFLNPEDHQDLNEELIFAYMEGQKLEYHDDGEDGLGPQIATLSLGGKAKMHLRIKTKHYVGCSKTGVFAKERPIPGSIGGTVDGVELSSQEMYERRLAAWEELQQLTDRKEYNKRAKEIPLELGLFGKRMKKADDLVTITLNHGDIVLMEGYDVQKYCEHRVVPEQCLRFALTCRTILSDHLKPEERPAYGAEPDEEGMSALRRMVDRESSARMADAGPGLKEN